MKGDKILSVFVDESGMFKYPDPDSRFYISASCSTIRTSISLLLSGRWIGVQTSLDLIQRCSLSMRDRSSDRRRATR